MQFDKYLFPVCVCTIRYLHRKEHTYAFVKSLFISNHFDGYLENVCGCRERIQNGYCSLTCKSHREEYEDVFSGSVLKAATNNCILVNKSKYATCPICFDLQLLFCIPETIQICLSENVMQLLPQATIYSFKHAEVLFNAFRLNKISKKMLEFNKWVYDFMIFWGEKSSYFIR